MHSSELLTCAWAWICIWLCELVWCLVGVYRGVNPVTQPLAMFVFKVNESLPPSAARILFSKECPPASVDMGLACHTRLQRPELQNLLCNFIKTIVIFALKTKFCVNSLYFLFRLRKKYEWIIVQHVDSDKVHWQPALPVSTTSILYCVFISESVARCHCLQNLVVWEEGWKTMWTMTFFSNSTLQKKFEHPVSASPCAFICLWPKRPFEAGCVSQHVKPLLPHC